MFFFNVDIFKGMEKAVIDEIARSSSEESYKKGDFIIREGTPANYFFILKEGEIRLSVGEKGQISHLVSESGEAFGWSSLVDRETYTASAECLIPSKVLKIHKERLAEILERDPRNASIFYKRLASMISDRLVSSYRTLLSTFKREEPPSYG